MYQQGEANQSKAKRKRDILSDDDSNDEESPEIMEIELDSEDDLECTEWDVSCKVINIYARTEKIIGFHLMPTCLPEPKIKEIKQPTFKKLLKESLLENFKSHWNCNKTFDNEYFNIIVTPWKACVIKDLLEDSVILKNIRQEFYEVNWNRRKMDLYDFHQSVDLKNIHLQNIQFMYDFLKKDVMGFVGELLNIKLTHISATCSFYADTDYLLVHDDLQEDRVIAFVLYLSDIYDWKNCWGGALQLLDHDDNFQPKCTKQNIFPKNNQLVLFPVSTVSYHQVDEVMNKNFSRYSINGWFHGKVATSEKTPICPSFIYGDNYLSSKICGIDLKEFIKEDYLAPENIKDIQDHIEEYSEISLPNYFKNDFFNEISQVLDGDLLRWKSVGPPNRINYEVLINNNEIEVLQTLFEIFQSQVMFKLLECYTELEFSTDKAGLKCELQRWSPGSYALLSDYDWATNHELDVIMYFGCKNIIGGQIQYIEQEKEIQHALVTLEHQNNTLNLIYRDSARINCYVSKYTPQPFYILICSYNEKIKT